MHKFVTLFQYNICVLYTACGWILVKPAPWINEKKLGLTNVVRSHSPLVILKIMTEITANRAYTLKWLPEFVRKFS